MTGEPTLFLKNGGRVIAYWENIGLFTALILSTL
jgi:hypothetical protein